MIDGPTIEAIARSIETLPGSRTWARHCDVLGDHLPDGTVLSWQISDTFIVDRCDIRSMIAFTAGQFSAKIAEIGLNRFCAMPKMGKSVESEYFSRAKLKPRIRAVRLYNMEQQSLVIRLDIIGGVA